MLLLFVVSNICAGMVGEIYFVKARAMEIAATIGPESARIMRIAGARARWPCPVAPKVAPGHPIIIKAVGPLLRFAYSQIILPSVVFFGKFFLAEN